MTTSSTQGAPGKGEVEEAVNTLLWCIALRQTKTGVLINPQEAEKIADLLTRQQARIEELEEKIIEFDEQGASDYTDGCGCCMTTCLTGDPEWEALVALAKRSAAESALSDGGGREGEDDS